MDQQLVNQIAEAYIAAPNDPTNPPAWEFFIDDTLKQFDNLTYSGWRFTEGQYITSTELFEDCRHKRLMIYKGGSNLTLDHPLAIRDWSGWTMNEIFRAVHDVNGHYATLSPFETFDGEVTAYQQHRLRYSTKAIPVLFAETIGQLCYYYSGRGFVALQEAKVLPEVAI
jgi:hypothetical protein